MENKVIKRVLNQHLKKVATYYPVISLAGPRQAGKSTLLRDSFTNYEYISLENPDIALFARTDPRGFFNRYSEGVIIDEAQKIPELFSYLQGLVDEKRIPGRFILSGSQNYLLHRGITQSLAGRVDISTLFPLDFEEMSDFKDWDSSLESLMVNGFYPGRWVHEIPPKIFYSNYIRTYLERDVSDLVNIGNLATFRSFLKLLAYHCGTQVKITEMSNSLNVSFNTIKSWLTILESSYIIFTLAPYYNNFGKRLLKTPKYYFYDTGLLCRLLGLGDNQKLLQSDKYGIIFENMVIAEKIKFLTHRHIHHDMFFFRDSNGMEVDLIEADESNSVKMYEIKSGRTFKADFLKNMTKLKNKDNSLRMNVIYAGDQTLSLKDYAVSNWKEMHRAAN